MINAESTHRHLKAVFTLSVQYEGC